jgi:hypothetical protein
MITGRFFRSGICRGALFSATLLIIFAASGRAQGINTISGWNGTSFISSFGVPDTATYGQTVTVGAGASPLKSFGFEIGYCGADVTLRGSVYAWDGTKATGPSLYESPGTTVTNSSAFQLVTFNVGDLSLAPGTYVLFASTSNDQTGALHSGCQWGSVGNNTAYAGGQFVFLNNGPDPAKWTTTQWSSIAQDLAFRVDGLVVPVPAASTTSLLIGFAGLIAVGSYRMARSRRRTS